MEKLIYKHQQFIKILDALEQSIQIFSCTDIDEKIRKHLVASVIKHFEMCYEASWKFLKLYLEVHYGQIANSPREVFRQCFTLHIFDEQTTKDFLKICDARNTTTHTYDEENAKEICKRIDSYYEIFKKISCLSLNM